MIYLTLGVALFTVVLYTLFLAYCSIRMAKKNGKLAMAPKVVQLIIYSIYFVAAVLDGLFNITIGSLLFLEAPELRRLMFTARCAKWREDRGWRGRIARWVCDGWLNPFDAGHC